MKQVIIEPFHTPTRILMKLADSVSGHVKTKKSSASSFNSTFVAMATAYEDLGQTRSKNEMEIDIFTIKLLSKWLLPITNMELFWTDLL